MRIIFIHQNYPAQFGRFAEYLAKNGWDVHFATANLKVSQTLIKDVKIHKFGANREVSKDIHHYLRRTETAILNAQGFARVATKLKDNGFDPDIIVAHSGWGSGSLAKTVWPNAKFVQYLEWWYNYPHIDRLETEEIKVDLEVQAKTLFNNLPFYTDWAAADVTLVPTMFQANTIPSKLRKSIVVQHDGVDTDFFQPKNVKSKVKKKLGIPEHAKIITFATRGMEPHRGFPQFMEAWQEISKRNSNIHCVIAGSDTVHYGAKLPSGKTYKDEALSNLEIDKTRTHFVDRLPYDEYRDLLCATDCHVYLTLPFVLSWSLLDAMACAAPIVSNFNASVEEVMTDGTTGRLANLQNIQELVTTIEDMISNPKEAQHFGQNARQVIMDKYSISLIYPQKAKLFEKMVNSDGR